MNSLEILQQAYYKAMKNVVFVDFVNKSVIKIRNIKNMEGLIDEKSNYSNHAHRRI